MPARDKMFYRRQKVMKYFVSGMSQRKISYNLGISLATVERDIKHIREWLIIQNSLSGIKNFDMLL
jgi:transposase